MCRDRSRVRARGSHEVRPEPKDASRRPAYAWILGYCPGLLRVNASSRASSSLFARFATSCAHRWPTYNHLSILNHTLPSTPLCSWQTPHHPYQALHSLALQSRLSTHYTPASSSLPPLQPIHTANSPPLCARHRPPPGEILEQQAPLMSQNDRSECAACSPPVELSC